MSEIVTDGPFRSTDSDLDADERLTDAIRRLGEWRSALEIRTVILFLFAGLAASPLAWVLAKELQYALVGHWSLMSTLAAAVVAPLLVAFGVGSLVLRSTLRRRMPPEIARLAALHRVPVDELRRFANVPR